MAFESFISLRRFAGYGLVTLLLIGCVCAGAAAQTTPPLVTSTFVSQTAANSEYQAIWNIARANTGDVLVMDFQSGSVYQIPADGRPLITLGALGGWANPGVAVDQWNNLYVGDDWNGDITRVPYDPVAKTWTWSAKQKWTAGLSWFHPTAMSANSSGTLAVGFECCSVGIATVSIDEAGNAGTAFTVLTKAKARPRSLAIDTAGNVYFYEDGGAPGVYRIAAGATAATEADATRIDTMVAKDANGNPAYGSPVGVAVDPDGNVYISDSKLGVYVVPNENGAPNTSHTYRLTSQAALATVAIDAADHVLNAVYVPVSRPSTADPTKTVQDVYRVSLGKDLGIALVGGQGSTVNVYYTFNGDATPAGISCMQNGVELVQVAGDCKTDSKTTYHAGDACTATVALTPHAQGALSCNLEMQDSQDSVLASSSVQGAGELSAIVSSFVTGIQSHASNWGQVWQIAIAGTGDVVLMNFESGSVYQVPADGRPVTTLGTLGGWANPGVAVDQLNNLYLGNDWNGDMTRIPYDPVAKTWPWSAKQSWTAGMGWFHAAAMAANASGTLAIGFECCSVGIATIPIDASGNAGPVTTVLTKAKARPKSLAIDNAGNIYFYEDGGAAGVLRIPAGSTGVANETGLARMDPNLPNIGGVSVDAAGNVYITDNNLGLFMIPNENGAPNPKNAVLLTPVPAFANALIDSKRGLIYVDTKPGSWGGWNGFNDLTRVTLGKADLGSAITGAPGAAATVYYSFSGSVTPATFNFVEAGAAPDFTKVGGTCQPSTTYNAQSNCTVTLALNAKSAGTISGGLQMLDGEGFVLTSTVLHGTGQGAAISIIPAAETVIGGSLQTPGQVATDAAGNIYVADAGLGKVLQYAKGSDSTAAGTSIGTGLTAPTGVAVSGAGDVFIADSGSVIKVPFESGAPNAGNQSIIKSGLGTNLRLAVSGSGDLFVADTDNSQVVRFINPGVSFSALGQTEVDLKGFTSPSAVAFDAAGNLLVLDLSNLIQVASLDASRTTVLNTLANASDLAVDASNAVYVAQAGGTIRIPNGGLGVSEQTALAGPVTSPGGIALDSSGNLYLADSTAKNLYLVSINGTLDLGSPPLGSVGTSGALLLNIGNAPLTITGFGGGLSANSVLDFTAAGASTNGCDTTTPTPVAAGASCAVNATFNPGPGEEGPLSSQLTIVGNEANAPVLNVSGVGAALAKSKTSVTIESSANMNDVPVTVAVAPATGSGVPTGTVTVTVDGKTPKTGTLSNGSATVHFSGVTAGSHNVAALYNGDRTYARSTGSAAATVGKGAVTITLPENIPPYVLSSSNVPNSGDPTGASPPWVAYFYTFVVQVTASGGTPTGTVSLMSGSDRLCSKPVDATGTAKFRTDDTYCFAVNPDNTVPHVVTTETVTAVYDGDSNFLTKSSSAVTFNILKQPSVVISSNPATLTVAAGSAVTANLAVTSLLGYGTIRPEDGQAYNWYTLPLELQCNNLPAYAKCSFSPAQVNATEQVAGATTVTITTNTSVGTATAANRVSSAWTFGSMFAIGLIGLVFVRKTKYTSRILTILCSALLIGSMVGGITSCGTANLGSQINPQARTPAGSYTVTITAKQVGNTTTMYQGEPMAVNASQNQISLPFTVTLTVQ